MSVQKTTIARAGRFQKVTERLRLPVWGVKVGMRIVELDRPWTETPFLFQGFAIESVEHIEELGKYCQEVVVEFDREEWMPPTERGVLTAPSTRATFEYHAATPRDYRSAGTLVSASQSLTRSLMDDVRLGKAIDIKEIKATVSSAVKSIIDSPDAMLWMQKVRDRSEYTAEHCVNVGLLAITFGRHLGYSEADLNTIGTAGMLHDVGKALTPIEILHKDGALNAEEFLIMRNHTTDGRNILIGQPDVDPTWVDSAYSHHEALDGTGYPRKIKANGITDLTRIITICDVYDAITSDRCYRNGQSSLRAMDVLNREAGLKFDTRLVEEFVRCMGLYPTGSVVELRNGAHGIVVGTNYRNRRLPRVLVVRGEDQQPCEERVVDLQRVSGVEGQEGLLIRTVVPNGRLGIRVEEYVRRGLNIS